MAGRQAGSQIMYLNSDRRCYLFGTETVLLFLGVVYYTLGNIDPKYRSQLDSIQLLLIATTPVIKQYGIDALLEPFMNDLAYLEQVSL